MPVLDRSELEASPLADLHAIANELGVDGYRLLRREQLIARILGEDGAKGSGEAGERPARRAAPALPRASRPPARRAAARGPEAGARASARGEARGQAAERPVAEGVVELRDGGGAYLRVNPPGRSDEDLYISPAQVKRCELSPGDRVSGPVRRARRSERHASLARIDTINGRPAEEAVPAPAAGATVGERAGRDRGASARVGSGRPRAGARAGEPVPSFPTELLTLASQDPALQAVERLAPLGHGSRAVIVGASRAGKSELLRGMLAALAQRGEVALELVLVGVRPEEIPEWQGGPVAPSDALTFADPPEAQARALERALQRARRQMDAGRRVAVLVDTLDGLDVQVARKVLASAQHLRPDGGSASGSLTVIATALRPFGGETTVIALDASLAATGTMPALDVMASGTIRPELLVGEAGASAITEARAERAPAAPRRRRWLR